jgi:soluble lytic murein transglycosylase-like protein
MLMINTGVRLRLLLLAIAVLLAGSASQLHAKKRVRHKPKPPAASTPDDQEEAQTDGQIYVKLSDGTRMLVDDAWQSGQGIWYRKGGITHLLPSTRAKSIERGHTPKSEPQPQIAQTTETNPSQTAPPAEQPVWIYLKGGARFEVDTATESAAGVWYTRGPMSIFIERSRVDHIERETLATVAKTKELRWSSGRPRIDALIRQNGTKYGVDPYLIFCVMEQESHFNTYALSPKGARGLMQLMPGTGARFGVRRPFDPGQNIMGGTRYLKELLRRFNGRVDLVLASYNAGEGAVVRFGHRVPPYRETRNYVKRVGYRYRQAKSPVRPTTNSSTGTKAGEL